MTSYSYDYENRLIAAQTPANSIGYSYDPDGIRVSKEVDSAITHYVVDKNRPFAQVLEERNGSGALLSSYVYGQDLISRQHSAGSNYYHYDGPGSVRQLTEATENITDRYAYDAFGQLLDHDGVSNNSYRYAGEQLDPYLDNYYMRARYYQPNLGRFLTRDTFPAAQAEQQTLHRYVYAWNDPINKLDPSGQYTLTGVMITVVVIGILAMTAGCNRSHRGNTNRLYVSRFNIPIINDPDRFAGREDWIIHRALEMVRLNIRQLNVPVEVSEGIRPASPATKHQPNKHIVIRGRQEDLLLDCRNYIGRNLDPDPLGLAPICGIDGSAEIIHILNFVACEGGTELKAAIALGNVITHEAGHLWCAGHTGGRGNFMQRQISYEDLTNPALRWNNPSRIDIERTLRKVSQ
ncbi:MAG: RHS repeat domain-containing protein [bacterium]